jgi:hypothetical protein
MDAWMKYTKLHLIFLSIAFLWCCITLFYGLDPCNFELDHLGFFKSPYVRRKAYLGPISATPTRVDENPCLSSSYTPTGHQWHAGFCLDRDLAIAILRHRHKSRIDLLYYALVEPHVIIPLGVIQSSNSSAILIAYFCSCLFCDCLLE